MFSQGRKNVPSVVSLVVDNLVSKITWKINPRVVNTEEGFGRGLNFNTCLTILFGLYN